MKSIKTLMIVLSIALFTTIATASSYNTVDISTGIRADLPANPVYAFGQNDAFWRVVSSPQNQNIGQSFVPNVSVGVFTAWITIPGTRYINSNSTLAGSYEYQRCFCLDTAEKAIMQMGVRADNEVQVFLNQYSNQVLNVTAIDSFRQNPSTATVATGFVKGRNCVRVRVNNRGNTITGMDAKINVQGWGAKEVADKCCPTTSKLFLKKVTVGPKKAMKGKRN